MKKETGQILEYREVGLHFYVNCVMLIESAVSNLGNFNINRSIDENLKVYEYIRVNPDKLSESVTKVCKRGEKLSIIKYGSYAEGD